MSLYVTLRPHLSKHFVDDWKDLQLITIYFDTPGYEEITKDSAAKFADMLSVVGGTFGLLTGFSLVSGVEILFFMAKFLVSLASNNQQQKKSSSLPNV